MKYLDITYPDINNGLGCRVTIWVSGCLNHCPFCHNQFTWDKDSGKNFDYEKTIKEVSDILEKPYISGWTLSGGEPLDLRDEEKLPVILNIVKILKEKHPNKNLWVYSGFTLDELLENDIARTILSYTDVLVDGRYVHELRNTSLEFRGSSNQIIWKNVNGKFEKFTELMKK